MRIITLMTAVSLLCGCAPESQEPRPVEPSSGRAELAGLQWIDTHVHLWSHVRIDDYVAYQQQFGMRRMVLLSPPRGAALATGGRPNVDAEALLAKARFPDRFYVFGGVDLTPLLHGGGEAALRADLAAQVNELADAGADGLKLYFKRTVVEGLQQQFGFEFLPDKPVLAPLFQAAAARHLPVLVHIDPQYSANGMRALAMYPDVTWVVTHLGFAPDQAQGLGALLDAHPNVYLDVGHYVHAGELIHDGRLAAIQLFVSHPQRIFVSSDFASGCELWGLDDEECPSPQMAVEQVVKLRTMFETTQQVSFVSAYTGQQISVTGLGLPATPLRGVYGEGALALLGAPKPIVCAPALLHVDRLIAHTTLPTDLETLKLIKAQLVDACAL